MKFEHAGLLINVIEILFWFKLKFDLNWTQNALCSMIGYTTIMSHYNEWQQVTTNEKQWQRMKTSKKLKKAKIKGIAKNALL